MLLLSTLYDIGEGLPTPVESLEAPMIRDSYGILVALLQYVAQR